jgi:hypothetical protein
LLGNLESHEVSDEVELWLLVLEVLMHYRWLLVSSSTLTYKSSKSVSISDTRGLLDGTRDVVVSVAKFVGQQLNLVWGRPYGVIDDGEPSWSSHALTSSHRH